MVGKVARREVHLAIDDISISASREKVVDFSDQYIQIPMSMITPSRKQMPRTFAIFLAFPPEVWGLLLVSILVSGLVWWVLAYYGNKADLDGAHNPGLMRLFFNTIRALLNQENQIETNRSEQRILLFVWYYFTLLVQVIYSGMLIATFTAPLLEPPIDYLEDLPDAVSRGYTIGIWEDTSGYRLFQKATAGIYNDVWKLFNPEESFFSNDKIFIKKIAGGGHIYIANRVYSMGIIAETGKSRLRLSKASFFPQHCGVVLFSGCPFKKAINEILIRLNEAGLVDMWLNEELRKVKVEEEEVESSVITLALDHVQAAFLVLGIGFCGATLVLLAEIILSTKVKGDAVNMKI